LAKVKRPDSAEVSFKYDALGRRISKRFRNIITRWTWDGNVPLHEQKTQYWRDYEKERGEFLREDKQPLVTWVFEEGTFVPVARITEKQQLSIVTNYLGTPEAMYREDGEAVWTCELNSYGKVRNFQGEFKTDCPFRYQGQYEDSETGLFYNRFRYYSAEEGVYLSQDPIGLNGGIKLYTYVKDTNTYTDISGLTSAPSTLPNTPGIYIITNGNDSYVGSSGIGTQGMNQRTSSSQHTNAQVLLNRQGTTVEYIQINGLENVKAGNGRTKGGNRNIILRYYEQKALDDQLGKNKNMLNGKKMNGDVSRILNEKKMAEAEALIKKHKITQGNKTKC
jgi:RHS repeat-associated protein